jgi:hypothetical protein
LACFAACAETFSFFEWSVAAIEPCRAQHAAPGLS